MKRFVVILVLLLCASCAASNVNELRENGKHYFYYANDSLQNVYNRTIKKYNECGIPVSNTFIDNSTGEAGISYTLVGHGFFAHNDMKEERNNKTRIDVYGIITTGLVGDFMKIAQYAAENKEGCPE